MKMKLNRRRLLVVLGVFVVLGAAAIVIYSAAHPQVPPQNTAVVRRGDLSASVSATGKVTPSKQARLSLPVSGMVESVDKQPGDAVNRGDLILSLRADDAARRVRQAQLALDARQLDLARAKAAPADTDIEIAQANLNKARLAFAAADAAYAAAPSPQGDAARQSARQDLDIATANFDRVTAGPTQAQIDALENTIAGARLDLVTAQQVLTQTRLTAPFTATVTEVDVRPGELVGGYSQLALVADLSVLEIDAEIDEIDVANVQPGQPVRFRFDAFPGQSFDGKLTRLNPSASTQRGSTAYDAVVEFDPRGVKVRPGMGANLDIMTIEKTGVLLVPDRALKSVGTRQAVHALAPGAPRDVIVETGVSDGNDTEIVNGLNEGDVVQLN